MAYLGFGLGGGGGGGGRQHNLCSLCDYLFNDAVSLLSPFIYASGHGMFLFCIFKFWNNIKQTIYFFHTQSMKTEEHTPSTTIFLHRHSSKFSKDNVLYNNNERKQAM